jgi:hypothetical protein
VPTTPASTPSIPVTGRPGVTPSTVIVHHRKPYDPGYSTIDQLVQDSTFIVLGTLLPATHGVDQTEKTVVIYPIRPQRDFDSVPPITLTITPAEVTAARLRVGETYVFFWAADPAEKTACLVGGVRGVMSYNKPTDTVTRLDTSRESQIPLTQSLEQFSSSVNAAQDLFSHEPIRNQPPVCSPAATGLPSA